MDNKLNAIHHGLIKAFDNNYKEVVADTYNSDAFMIIKNFLIGVPQEVTTVAQEILIRLNGPRWKCILASTYQGRNPLAIYLAKLGGEKCNHLYTLTRPWKAAQELMNLDLGFGHIDPRTLKSLIIKKTELTLALNFCLH